MGLFKRRRDFGPLLLCIWLIAQGITALIPLPIPFLGQILAVVAIAAGVLILLDR
jgi:hypothetical protein